MSAKVVDIGLFKIRKGLTIPPKPKDSPKPETGTDVFLNMLQIPKSAIDEIFGHPPGQAIAVKRP